MAERITHIHYHKRPAHSAGAHHDDPDTGESLEPVLRCTQEGAFEDGEARYKCEHGTVVDDNDDDGGW